MRTCLFVAGLLIVYIITMAILWQVGPYFYLGALGPFILVLLYRAARQVAAW
jgi:hypothetical protein